jgi:NADH dehydrogenase
MHVGLIGGTGFVGSYLTDALIDAGHTPVLLVRPGSESRVQRPESCMLVSGDVDDDNALDVLMGQCEAVIFNIGLLREKPSKGITFEALQQRAAIRAVDHARERGVRRFLLMSANGVDAEETAYQRTKRRAERHLEDSGLDWTIFRPSVIFGEPRGRQEFCSQLKRDVIDSPLPAPLFFPGLNPVAAGRFELSPVHVADVAEAFVRALDAPETVHRVLHLGGPATLSWQAILKTIAEAAGRRKLMLPVPALGVSAAATLFDRWESFPVTRDQLHMLLQGNRCDSTDLEALGIEPRAFDTGQLAYLAHIHKEHRPCPGKAA